MRTIDMSIFNTSLFIYSANERDTYEKDTDVDLSDHRGYTADNYIFCNGETGVCFHEAVHFTDWLLGTHLNMEQGSLWSNTELRAYLVQFVGEEIMKYCGRIV